MFNLKYVLYYDDGEIVEVRDLFNYLRVRDIRMFVADMKYINTIRIAELEYYYTRWHEKRKCYVYNENGVMISPELLYAEFMKEYNKERPLWWNGKLYHNVKSWMRISRRRSHTNTRYKHPRTQNERRLNVQIKEDGEPQIRGKRKPSNLSTRWDDIHVRRSCSWKITKRKHQYKD